VRASKIRAKKPCQHHAAKPIQSWGVPLAHTSAEMAGTDGAEEAPPVSGGHMFVEVQSEGWKQGAEDISPVLKLVSLHQCAVEAAKAVHSSCLCRFGSFDHGKSSECSRLRVLGHVLTATLQVAIGGCVAVAERITGTQSQVVAWRPSDPASLVGELGSPAMPPEPARRWRIHDILDV
jgi:hypothetical protein